jgi:hypothetical protein
MRHAQTHLNGLKENIPATILNSLNVNNNTNLKTLNTTDLSTLFSLLVINNSILNTLTTNNLATLDSLKVINDSNLKIQWPLENVILSEKDQLAQKLFESDVNFL